MSIIEAAQQHNFYLHFENKEIKLKTDHDYYYQVQGQLNVTGRAWCDFCVYTKKDCFTERIYKDDLLWENMLHEILNFFNTCLGPEILRRAAEQ